MCCPWFLCHEAAEIKMAYTAEQSNVLIKIYKIGRLFRKTLSFRNNCVTANFFRKYLDLKEIGSLEN
jgi:hypothetical protein